MNQLLDEIRFAPERALLERLFERYGLDVLIEHFVESGGARPTYDLILGSHLRLTPLLAPRLTSLLDEVKRTLSFEEPVELFVGQDAEVNAGAMPSIGAELPHVVTLTSALVERMTDDELRFVLGHELGHLAFRHYRARMAAAAFGQDEQGEPRTPPLLMRRMESWDRLAEISADRAGFLVIGGNLATAVAVFFKIQSGLGPEHLRFDLRAFLEQLESLQKLERRELLARFSHPATPIRVRALQLFGEARSEGRALASADPSISEIARLMDYAPGDAMEIHQRDILVAGGLLLTELDGGMDERAWNVLAHMLLPYSADPEAEVERVRSKESAHALLAASASFLAENTGEERFDAIRKLAHVAAVDGRYASEELELLHTLAEQLDVPRKAADAILFDVLAEHLQVQAVEGGPIPKLGGRRSTPP
ncbi:MAG: M48 family metallopeptidase [Sandaracinaceae bacterium]|nr:M48 family metallopeptidase [Sandaracinaceae bacterium]